MNPSYLYAAKYLTLPEIIAGDVQPSGIPGFLQGRILHLLFLKGVIRLQVTAEPGFHVLQFIHLLITVLNLWLIGRIAQAADAAVAIHRRRNAPARDGAGRPLLRVQDDGRQ